MNRNKSPRIGINEIIKEVYNRTGYPQNAIFQILFTYFQIVKECIFNQVEIVFGDIGVFTCKFHKERKNVKHVNPKTKEIIYKDHPSYYKMDFKQFKRWKDEVKDRTSYNEDRKENKNELG